jgi:hypothetical protein
VSGNYPAPPSVLSIAFDLLPPIFKPLPQRASFLQLAKKLLWVPTGIFETTLGAEPNELAFAAGVSPQETLVWPVLAPFLSASYPQGKASEKQAFQDFITKLLVHDSPNRVIYPSLWCEWHLPSTDSQPILDGLYLQSDQIKHPAHSLKTWKTEFSKLFFVLTGDHCSAQIMRQIETVLFCLPESISISYVGVMFARNNSLKLCLLCRHITEVRYVVQQLKLPDQILSLGCDTQGLEADYWVLNLDLGILFGRRWGLEYYLAPNKKRSPEPVTRWTQWLQERGLCTQEQAQGINDWQRNDLPPEHVPDINLQNYKCLNHLKLISTDGLLSAKAYLFFACKYLRVSGNLPQQ